MALFDRQPVIPGEDKDLNEILQDGQYPEGAPGVTNEYDPGLMPESVHFEDGTHGPAFRMNDVIRAGIHQIRTQYDGGPVRVVPASKMVTLYIALSPGSTWQIAERDPRRISMNIWVTEPTGTVNYLRVGNSLPTVLSLGAALKTNSIGPYRVVLQSTDRVAVGAPAANSNTVYVSAIMEIQE